jgi:hypothetical protein
MSLTIEIPPDLEEQLRSEAARAGIDAAQYAVQALKEQVAAATTPTQAELEDEPRLIRAINEGLSEEDWQTYRSLIAKRQAECLTAAEQVELISYSDRLEELSARRIELLARLARLRNRTLRQTMEDLGLHVPTNA